MKTCFLVQWTDEWGDDFGIVGLFSERWKTKQIMDSYGKQKPHLYFHITDIVLDKYNELEI